MEGKHVLSVEESDNVYSVKHIGGVSLYTVEELKTLGGGDTERGLDMLVAGVEASPRKDFIAGKLRPLDSVLQALTEEQAQQMNKEAKG